MARPRQRGARIDLSPRARLIGGWVAALVLVLLIAAAVRLFGGNADGTSVLPSATSGGSPASPHPITFGTELDADRTVPSAAESTRFVPEDLFAYSVAEADPASTIYVAVRRTAGGPVEVVQPAVDAQGIPGGPTTIGFTVPAANLFEAFGPGTYEMLISLTAEGAVIAVGSFELVAPEAASPSP